MSAEPQRPEETPDEMQDEEAPGSPMGIWISVGLFAAFVVALSSCISGGWLF